MKRKTQKEKIDEAVIDALDEAVIDALSKQGTTVQNCTFVGTQFDEAATEAITTIAEGLVENAKALGQLAYVLKSSNVEIETMLKVGK